jgi:hypothetical protein
MSSQYEATIGAAESIIAQLHSQGKLITPRREKKNSTRKQNERLHKVKVPKNMSANLVRLSL